MQSVWLPGRTHGRSTACSPGQQVPSQPGKECLDHEWVKVAAPVLGALHKQRVSGGRSKPASSSRLPVPAVNQLSLACTSAACAHHQAVSKAADETWLHAVNHLCFSSLLGKYFGSEKQRNLGNNGSESGIPPLHGCKIVKRH